jgi:hypothetical protein
LSPLSNQRPDRSREKHQYLGGRAAKLAAWVMEEIVEMEVGAVLLECVDARTCLAPLRAMRTFSVCPVRETTGALMVTTQGWQEAGWYRHRHTNRKWKNCCPGVLPTTTKCYSSSKNTNREDGRHQCQI